MSNSLPEDVRDKYIKELKEEEKEYWVYFIIVPLIMIYIFLLNAIGVPTTGWWILLWIVIGFFIVGISLAILESLTKTEEKLSNHSDELLSTMHNELQIKKESKKKRGQLWNIFLAGALLILFITNPDQNSFKAKISNTSDLFSSTKYKSFYLFSVYHSRNSLTNKEVLYIGFLNQVFPIDQN